MSFADAARSGYLLVQGWETCCTTVLSLSFSYDPWRFAAILYDTRLVRTLVLRLFPLCLYNVSASTLFAGSVQVHCHCFHTSIVIEIFCVHLLLCLSSTAPAVVFSFKSTLCQGAKVACIKTRSRTGSTCLLSLSCLVSCFGISKFKADQASMAYCDHTGEVRAYQGLAKMDGWNQIVVDKVFVFSFHQDEPKSTARWCFRHAYTL